MTIRKTLISAALSLVGAAAAAGIAGISACYGELEERLNSLAVEAEDIAQTAGGMLSDVDFDEADLEKAENRS